MNYNELDNLELLETYIEETKFIDYLEKTIKQINNSIEADNNE